MRNSPDRAVWIGPREQTPSTADFVLRSACCGECYADFYECLDPLIQTALFQAAHDLCQHSADSRILCPACSWTIRLLAERARGSGQWLLLDHRSMVETSCDVLTTLGLIDEQTSRSAQDRFDDWNDEPDRYLASTFGQLHLTLEQAHTVIDTIAELSDQIPP